MPLSMVHFITERCNARCGHCFLDDRDRAGAVKELSLDEIETLTRHMGRGLRHVSLTGGEPFLREDILGIARAYAVNAGVRYLTVPTNGAYTDRVARFIDGLIASGVRSRVRIAVSLDDLEDGHDRNRGVPGLFRKAMQTYACIEAYRHPRITPAVAITVTPGNYATVAALYRELRGRVKNFSAVLMREQGRIDRMEKKSEVLDAYMELCRLIAAGSAAERGGGIGRRLTGAFIRARMQVLPGLLSRVYLGGGSVPSCPSGTRFGVIRAGGDVHPCEPLGGRAFGNLRDYAMEFSRLWRGDRAGSCRKTMRNARCACTYECAWSVNKSAIIRVGARMLKNVLVPREAVSS